MILDKGKHFLYRHTRLDTGEPFYIGIGTKRKWIKHFISIKDEYFRAYRKSRKKEFWDRVVNKAGYEVEVLVESDNYDFIKQKEIEFIKLYGRRNIGTGTLVNLTDGGEGLQGYTATEETRIKQRLNRSIPKGGKSTSSKKCYQYTKQGDFIKEWDCITTASKYIDCYPGDISWALRNPSGLGKGFLWFNNYKGVRVPPYRKASSKKVRSINYLTGKEKVFETVKEAAKSIGKHPSTVNRWISGDRERFDKFHKWEYIDTDR